MYVMSIVGDRIRELREKLGLRQSDLAEKVGISGMAISTYESDKRMPSRITAEKLADVFQVSIDYLLGRTDNPTPAYSEKSSKKSEREFKKFLEKAKIVPLFDGAHAGNEGDLMSSSNAVGTFLIPVVKEKGIDPDFVVEVHGDSMEPEITDGSAVAVQKDVEIKNGDMVMVIYDGEALVKKMFSQNDTITLQSLNSQYPPITIKKNEKEKYISGKVVYIIRLSK